MEYLSKREKIRQVQSFLGKNLGVDPLVFSSRENVILPSDTTFFQAISFGQGLVILAHPELVPWCERYLMPLQPDRILDGNHLYDIERRLRLEGKQLSGQRSRYLFAHPERAVTQPEGYGHRLYVSPQELAELHRIPGFRQALDYTEHDAIGYGALAGDALVCLAAADKKMDPLWQIGIDTIPSHRGKGLARHVVHNLAKEIEAKGKIAFYTTWSANIASSLVAVQAGFEPVWLEYMAEDVRE